MRIHFCGLEYGFGGTPTITMTVDGMVDSFSRRQAKDIEIVVGAILEGRTVVLSGKDIAMHNPCDTRALEESESIKQQLSEARAENARLTVKLEKFQKVVDTRIENDQAMFMLSTQSETVRKRREELQGRR